MKKTTTLKNIINGEKMEFLMEAHNGISAKIVEEAGFKCIWASGLAISSSLGKRDNNELSYTQVLDTVEYMSEATSIPILMDGDSGFGNFNNARQLIKKLETRNIAGVCIEDKLFPKNNSFLEGSNQQLEKIETFCGKIKAMKDCVVDDDFVIIARVEAFIGGYGLREALKRAEAYRLSGADAILIHSKKPDASEIIAFMKEWGNRLPIIIVPTTYYTTPMHVFEELGIRIIIWANHMIRSSVNAMQDTSKQIYSERGIINAEKKFASINEIFRLQNIKELQDAEKKYLPNIIKGENND